MNFLESLVKKIYQYIRKSSLKTKTFKYELVVSLWSKALIMLLISICSPNITKIFQTNTGEEVPSHIYVWYNPPAFQKETHYYEQQGMKSDDTLVTSYQRTKFYLHVVNQIFHHINGLEHLRQNTEWNLLLMWWSVKQNTM